MNNIVLLDLDDTAFDFTKFVEDHIGEFVPNWTDSTINDEAYSREVTEMWDKYGYEYLATDAYLTPNLKDVVDEAIAHGAHVIVCSARDSREGYFGAMCAIQEEASIRVLENSGILIEDVIMRAGLKDDIVEFTKPTALIDDSHEVYLACHNKTQMFVPKKWYTHPDAKITYRNNLELRDLLRSHMRRGEK